MPRDREPSEKRGRGRTPRRRDDTDGAEEIPRDGRNPLPSSSRAPQCNGSRSSSQRPASFTDMGDIVFTTTTTTVRVPVNSTSVIPIDNITRLLQSAQGPSADVSTRGSMAPPPVPQKVKEIANSNASKNSGQGQRGESRNKRSQSKSPKTNTDDVVPKDKPNPDEQPQRAPCDNCGLSTHTLLSCMGPININGFIDGCPHCETTDHIFERCSEYNEELMCYYFRIRRANRPPMMATIDADKIPAVDARSGLIPWTAHSTLEYQEAHPNFWEGYEYHSDPTKDAILFVDEAWDSDLPRSVPDSVPAYGPVRQATKKLNSRQRKRIRDVSQARPPKRAKGDGEELVPEDAEMGNSNNGVTGATNASGTSAAPVPPAPAPAVPAAVPETAPTGGTVSAVMEVDAPIPAETPKSGGRPNTGRRPAHPDQPRRAPKHCEHCNKNNHDTRECFFICGCCGAKSSEHVTKDCPNAAMKCICMPNPQHVYTHCTVWCTQAGCTIKEQHAAVGCTVRCCKCGKPGHPALECNKHKTSCPCMTEPGNAGVKPHFTFEHKKFFTNEEIICGAQDCFSYLCYLHCRKCLQVHPTDGCTTAIRTDDQNRQWVTCPKPNHGEHARKFHCPKCRPGGGTGGKDLNYNTKL